MEIRPGHARKSMTSCGCLFLLFSFFFFVFRILQSVFGISSASNNPKTQAQTQTSTLISQIGVSVAASWDEGARGGGRLVGGRGTCAKNQTTDRPTTANSNNNDHFWAALLLFLAVDVDFVLWKYQSYWGQLLVLQVGNHLDTQAQTHKQTHKQTRPNIATHRGGRGESTHQQNQNSNNNCWPNHSKVCRKHTMATNWHLAGKL